MMTMLSTLRSLGPADNPASLQNSLPSILNPVLLRWRSLPQTGRGSWRRNPDAPATCPETICHGCPDLVGKCTGRARCPAAKPGSPATKAPSAIVQWHGRKTTWDASASQVTPSHAATCYDGDADDDDDNVSRREHRSEKALFCCKRLLLLRSEK